MTAVRGQPMCPVSIGAQRTELLEPPDSYLPIFRERRSILCVDLLDPSLLAAMLNRCRRGEFVPDHVDRIGSREVEAPQRVGAALNVILSRAPFLRWVEAATGTTGLSDVEGRVVQARANGSDQLRWHDDLTAEPRRLGITINLSDAAFEGGEFELRAVGSEACLTRYRHDRAGTALIFDVRQGIEHRVLPVTAGGPRRMFTGWFFKR